MASETAQANPRARACQPGPCRAARTRTRHTTHKPRKGHPDAGSAQEGRSVRPNRPEERTMTQTATGRTSAGRFAPGNPGGPGNPHAPTVARLRAAILAAVTPDDIEAIVRALVHRAKGGDLGAARELLDRAIGKATDADLAERIDALERMAEQLREGVSP